MQSGRRTAPARYKSLDGLRGVAALLVVAFHIRWTNHFVAWPGVKNGFLAVDLFFMLSGFVLADTHIDSLQEFRAFLRRRLFRLYPLHVATLGVLVAFELAKGMAAFAGKTLDHQPFSGPFDLSALPLHLVLLQSIAAADLTWNSPSWSISCEGLAYIAFGLAVLGGLTRSRRFDASAFATAIVLYGAVAWHAGSLDAAGRLGVLRCFAGFLTGVGLFRYSQRAVWLWQLSALHLSVLQLGVAAWAIAALALADGPSAVVILPAFALTLMFLQQDRGTLAHWLQKRPISGLGRISYSIYMVHFPVILVVERGLHYVLPQSDFTSRFIYISLNPWLGDALFLAVSAAVIGFSVTTFRLIEEPWRERGRPTAARAPARAGADAAPSSWASERRAA